MTTIVVTSATRQPRGSIAPATTRTVLLLAIVVAVAVGWLATGAEASAEAVGRAGPELTHLLRAMAGLKLLMGAGLMAGVWWRLGDPVGPVRLACYAAAAAGIASGPTLIWRMTHVGAGAALLHVGLLATLLLLWRDPATGTRLAAVIAARRGSPGGNHGSDGLRPLGLNAAPELAGGTGCATVRLDAAPP